MSSQFAACAEFLRPDKPIAWQASRLHEMGFGAGLWNWPDRDLYAPEKTGATCTIMNGCLQGRQRRFAGTRRSIKDLKRLLRAA